MVFKGAIKRKKLKYNGVRIWKKWNDQEGLTFETTEISFKLRWMDESLNLQIMGVLS